MKMNDENGWENPGSVFKVETKDGTLAKVTGRYVLQSAFFEFNANRQKSGRYPIRGKVRALSCTGATLKKRGLAKKEILDSLPESERNDSSRKLNVETDFYCTITTEAEIKRCIAKAVERLYSENAELIQMQVAQSARPDTISPNTAAQLKAVAFVSYSHNRASDKEREKYVKRIKNCCAKLSPKAMKDFSKGEIKKMCIEFNIGDNERKELRAFWQYCIDRGVCAGKNPVEAPVKKRTTGAANKAKAMRIEELDAEMVEKLYKLLNDNLNDASVGVGLMLSGFEPKHIVSLKWRDIIFHKHKDGDFAVVRLFKDEGAGATKNYSRPAVPRVAVMLRKHYLNNLNKVGEDEIKDCYVIRNKNSQQSPYRAQYLVQEATRLINLAGISFRVLDAMHSEDRQFAAARKILYNTYCRHILDNCRLNDDPGTANFLLGRAFGMDTTSSAYTSFTSPEGELRLYTVLKILQEDCKIKSPKETQVTNNRTVLTFVPKKTREFVGITGTVSLAPGEKITIKCPHGAKEYAEVFSLDAKET